MGCEASNVRTLWKLWAGTYIPIINTQSIIFATKVNGFDCDVMTGTGANGLPRRMYFDRETGLLARVVRLAQTPVGPNPTQIDYADYRVSDGVKIPFRWTLARPNGRFAIQVASVKNNVAVDPAKFSKP